MLVTGGRRPYEVFNLVTFVFAPVVLPFCLIMLAVAWVPFVRRPSLSATLLLWVGYLAVFVAALVIPKVIGRK
jgi:hypothetical protein